MNKEAWPSWNYIAVVFIEPDEALPKYFTTKCSIVEIPQITQTKQNKDTIENVRFKAFIQVLNCSNGIVQK